jgi:hypothetical protein
VTYTLGAKIFSAGAYGSARDSSTLWSLALTANGTPVAIDHWFSDEFQASTAGAGNGGNIPANRIVQVTASSNGLTTVTLTYTATAADAGKTIGIQLGGDTQSKYTLAPGAPGREDYYGMMDSITLLPAPGGPADPNAGPATGTHRVIRGGSWLTLSRDCRSAYRTVFWPGSRSEHLGFRLANQTGGQ